MVSILELAKYGDLYSFLCAKKRAMVTQANNYWANLDPNFEDGVQMCAHATGTPPRLNFSIPELLDYVPSGPFIGILSQPLSELHYSVFAHQIAMGLQHLSSHNVCVLVMLACICVVKLHIN